MAIALTVRLAGFSELAFKQQAAIIKYFVHGVALENAAWLKLHPSNKPLYEDGIRYAREPEFCPVLHPQYGRINQRCETWRDIPDAQSHRVHGVDCKVMCAWRLAELWNSGERDAQCEVSTSEDADGNPLFHVYVRRGRAGQGRKEDPSARLGMNANG